MSELDRYKEAQRGHEQMCEIINECKPLIASVSTHRAGHHVEFQFRFEGGTPYHSRLGEMLGKACGVKLQELVETARLISAADLAALAQAAQDEAVETLKTITVEKD